MNTTPKQLKILQAIDDCRRKEGYSPTMQELADKFGISKVTVFEHVQALERKGLLDRERHKARSLNLSARVKLPSSSSNGILPLVGSIAAGKPIEAIENPDSIDLRDLFASRSQTFMLRVRGDSMIEDHIADGDMVIAEQRSTARDGEIVVALLEDGSATLKRFYRESGRIRLQPANGTMEPIYVNGDVKIQGVVIGVLRRYSRVGKTG